MEESFVVLPSAPISDGGGTQVPFAEAGTDSHLHPNSLGFHSTIAVLKRAFELATTQTQVCYCTLDEIGQKTKKIMDIIQVSRQKEVCYTNGLYAALIGSLLGVLSTRAAVCADNLRAKRDDNPCEGLVMSDCESVDETSIEDSATSGHPFQ
ncbi:Vacuolar protein sorting-associated protein atg6 [Dionaea muscipula]